MEPPEAIGKYEIVETLGQGGQGVVYLAYHPGLAVHRALKLFNAVADSERIEEAVLQARLEHENIVRVYDVGRHQGRPYLVMEHLPGGSLAGVLEAGPLELERTKAIALDLAKALEHAHAQGVIHRDLKPHNILLDEQGRAKITDFGLARLLGKDAPHHTRVAGTVAYLAPEQLRGRPLPQSDLWALGCIIHHMLTGRPPFGYGDDFTTMKAIAEDRPWGLRKTAPPIPREWADLLRRLLAKDPEQRPGSAAEVLAVMEGWGVRLERRVAVASPVTMEAGDWPCPRGGPGRSGSVQGALRPPLRELWRVSVRAPVLSSPAVCRGRVFLGSNNGDLVALDLLSGAVLWRHPAGEPAYLSPVAAGTALVTALPSGRVLALESATGDVIWETRLPWPAAGPPLLNDLGVFQVDQAGTLHRLSLTDGSPAGAWTGEDGCEGGPLYWRGLVMWASGRGLVQAVDPEHDQPVWRTRLKGTVEGSPASWEGYLLVQELEGQLCCLDHLTGSERWRHNLGCLAPATPAVAHGMVLAVGIEGKVVCLEVSSGKNIWQAEVEGAVTASPCFSPDYAVIANRGGGISLWDTGKGELVARLNMTSPIHSSPVIWRDILVAADTSGEIRVWAGSPNETE